MQLSLYEIFDLVKNASTENAKINVLRTNVSQILKDAVYLAYAPDIHFFTISAPRQYRPDRDAPIGMGWSHLGIEMRKMYLFINDHPASKHLSRDKREELLVRLLESLEPKEAEVVLAIFQKTIPNVPVELAKAAFPGLV
jgi:hypothetical protein